MRFHLPGRLYGVFSALFASGALACTSSPEAPSGAVVTFAFSGIPADTLRVQVTGEATIAAAESIVAGEQGRRFPIGPIRRGAGVDARYPFHFVADSVRLTQAAIELCDGAPMHTPEAVNVFIAGASGSSSSESAIWCPWNGYPIRVERL